MRDLMREKAYKMLYERYRNLNEMYKNAARNIRHVGNVEDKNSFLDSVIDGGKNRDIEILEYLVNDSKPVE